MKEYMHTNLFEPEHPTDRLFKSVLNDAQFEVNPDLEARILRGFQARNRSERRFFSAAAAYALLTVSMTAFWFYLPAGSGADADRNAGGLQPEKAVTSVVMNVLKRYFSTQPQTAEKRNELPSDTYNLICRAESHLNKL